MPGNSIGNLLMQPDEEFIFQKWIRGLPWFAEFKQEYGEEPDLSPSSDYDYRAAWKAGITPERDKYDKNKYHWPSSTNVGQMLKSANHPTAWKEHFMRATGINPDQIGAENKSHAIQLLNSIGVGR